MNEKYIAGIGGGLILTSFLIIVFFFVAEGVDDKYIVQNGTPGFSQLQTIKDDAKESLENNTILENFKQLVGNVTYEMKEKISVGINETLGEN
jgi:hypothetical protein